MRSLDYPEGNYYADVDPVPISYQGRTFPVFPRLWVGVNEEVLVWCPGLLIMASQGVQEGPKKPQSLFEKDPEFVNCKQRHLLSLVIGSESGPPSLRHPSHDRSFYSVLYKEFQYHVISFDSFVGTQGEGNLIKAARSCLEEVLNDDPQYILRVFGPDDITSLSGNVVPAVMEGLKTGVMVGISLANEALHRIAGEVYSRLESMNDPICSDVRRFEEVFEEDYWPQYKKARLEELKKHPALVENCSPLIN